MDEESSPLEERERLNNEDTEQENVTGIRGIAAPDPRGASADSGGEAVFSGIARDPRGVEPGEVIREHGPQPPPAAYASLPPMDDPPDFKQRSLREFSLPRTASHGSHRSSRRSLSSNHQSQLRKQAHSSPSFTAQRSPSAAGLPARSLSVGSTSVATSRNARSPPAAQAANRVIAPAILDIRPPLLDIPRAAYSGRAVSAPPPVESAPESDADVHSGWAVVDVMEGEAGGAPPCERSLHAAAVLNGNLCVFGGYDGQSRCNDFHAFSFTEKRWSPVLPSAASGNPPSPRDRHIAVAYANSFYVFGGFDGTSRVNDFFSFDFSSMAWREVPVTSGQPPSPRHSHAAVVHNHSMWVFGGYDGSYK